MFGNREGGGARRLAHAQHMHQVLRISDILDLEEGAASLWGQYGDNAPPIRSPSDAKKSGGVSAGNLSVEELGGIAYCCSLPLRYQLSRSLGGSMTISYDGQC